MQVYFLDLQIWYAVFSTLYGGFIGAFDRLGEVEPTSKLDSLTNYRGQYCYI